MEKPIDIFDRIIHTLRMNCMMYNDKKKYFVVGGDDWDIEIYESDIKKIERALNGKDKCITK